jgi:hypothetical protein
MTENARSLRWQRRLDAPPGVVDAGAARRIYERTAGWALQRIAHAGELAARHASADADAAGDLLLARAPAVLAGDDDVADARGNVPFATRGESRREEALSAAAQTVAAEPSATIARKAAPSSESTPSATAQRAQRRIEGAGVIDVSSARALDRSAATGASLRPGLHERLSARADTAGSDSSPVLQLARRLEPSMTAVASESAVASSVITSSFPTAGMASPESERAAVVPQASPSPAATHGPSSSRSDAGITSRDGAPVAPLPARSIAEGSMPMSRVQRAVLARKASLLQGSESVASNPRPHRADVGGEPGSAARSTADAAVTASLPVARASAYATRDATIPAQAMALARSTEPGGGHAEPSERHTSPIALSIAEAPLARSIARSIAPDVQARADAVGGAGEASVFPAPVVLTHSASHASPMTLSVAETPLVRSIARSVAPNVLARSGTIGGANEATVSPLCVVLGERLAPTASQGIARMAEAPAPAEARAPALVWHAASDAGARARNVLRNGTLMRAGTDDVATSTSPASGAAQPLADPAADGASASSASALDIARLAERVTRLIMRRLEIERDRRGSRA